MDSVTMKTIMQAVTGIMETVVVIPARAINLRTAQTASVWIVTTCNQNFLVMNAWKLPLEVVVRLLGRATAFVMTITILLDVIGILAIVVILLQVKLSAQSAHA
jgi:hypothetical protein